MDLSHVLSLGYPGAQWTLAGNDYEGLVWLDTSPMPKPTFKELQDKHVELTAANAYDALTKPALTDEAKAILLLLRSVNVTDEADVQEKGRLLAAIADKHSSRGEER